MSLNSSESAHRAPPSRISSLNTIAEWNDTNSLKRPRSAATYYGRSKSAVSWKSRGLQRDTFESTMSRDLKIRRWDGAGRNSSAWDGLRRDTELWFAEGDCFVHLYEHGQSKRGPAFRVPFDALVATSCFPMLDRFLVEGAPESPASEGSGDSGFFGHPDNRRYDLYIPAPVSVEREQSFLYHLSTRNFFAWMFGKPLVGTHLGGSIVGLLNSMNEFRSEGEDNVQSILEYLEGEVYADMRNSPDHALAILYFAEHFRFRDMWIDAFAHCCGMNDILITSIGFDYLSRQSRALITRTRMEMDRRLEKCGRQVSTFLSEELSESNLDLSVAGRAHLDHFRTWLQSYYVAKLGYYPPAPPINSVSAFPGPVFRQMRNEFQKLYNLLVDTTLASSDLVPVTRQGGVCILQTTRAFDQQCGHTSMANPFPLLPDYEVPPAQRKRFTIISKVEKVKPDDRVVFAALAKATNQKEAALYDCSLVRAYRGFEKECVVSSTKSGKTDQISPIEGRKIRWLLIYATLQTLYAATKVPEEVRDVHNVPYNLCILTAQCPPWNTQQPMSTLLRTQTEQAQEDYLEKMSEEIEKPDQLQVKPDIDYAQRMHRLSPMKLQQPQTNRNSIASRRGSVRKALSSLGSMPELHHPSPKKASFHEILVQGYGNGTLNTVQKTVEAIPEEEPKFDSADEEVESIYVEEAEEEPVFATEIKWNEDKRKTSLDSNDSQVCPVSSRWSKSSSNTARGADFDEICPLSISQLRRPSDTSSIYSDDEELPTPQPLTDFGLTKVAGSNHDYLDCVYDLASMSLKAHKPTDYDYYMTVTTDVSVKYEDKKSADTAANRRMSTISITY